MIDNLNYSIDGMNFYNGKTYWSDSMRKHIYIDNFISDKYFDINFEKHMKTFFGAIHYGIINFGGYFGTIMFLYVVVWIWRSITVGNNCYSIMKSDVYDGCWSTCFHSIIGGHHSHKIVDIMDKKFSEQKEINANQYKFMERLAIHVQNEAEREERRNNREIYKRQKSDYGILRKSEFTGLPIMMDGMGILDGSKYPFNKNEIVN